MGGISNEREVSLKSGEQVYAHLPRDYYNVHAIEITKEGKWILNGKKILRLFPENDLKKHIDVTFNALHGTFGEDGKAQAILETLEIPYTGSGILASALGMNKKATLELAKTSAILTPKTISIHNTSSQKQITSQIETTIGFPCVIKPNASGSSVGVSIVRTSSELWKALQKAKREDSHILAQEYIEGRELTCPILGNAKDLNPVSLPPIEIKTESTFFDYKAKYFSKKTQELCPAPIPSSLEKKIRNASQKIHLLLGCDGLTRSDFIYSPERNKLYFLEINTLPGLTEASLCPKAAKAAGTPFPELLHSLIQLALRKQGLFKNLL